MVIHLQPEPLSVQEISRRMYWIAGDLAYELRAKGVAQLNISTCSMILTNNIIWKLDMFIPLDKIDFKFNSVWLRLNLVGSPLPTLTPELSHVIESIRSKRWK